MIIDYDLMIIFFALNIIALCRGFEFCTRRLASFFLGRGMGGRVKDAFDLFSVHGSSYWLSFRRVSGKLR